MSDRHPKVPERAAEEIRRTILDGSLPAGFRLGSQDDVVLKMGVSRGSAREAMRLLEHQGLIQVRPGPGGGVYVAEPSAAQAVTVFSTLLGFGGLDQEELYSARQIVEPALAAQLAARRDDDRVRDTLLEALESEQKILARQHTDETIDFHRSIAELTTNRPMALFAEVLVDLTARLSSLQSFSPIFAEVLDAHEKITEAILAGNAELAQRRMLKHLIASSDWLKSAGKKPRRRRAGAR